MFQYQIPVFEVRLMGVYSEVYKAKSRKTGAIVAVKKILILNEKDGVCVPNTVSKGLKLIDMAVPYHVSSRNQDPKDVVSCQYSHPQ
jgi:hypothetical protein